MSAFSVPQPFKQKGHRNKPTPLGQDLAGWNAWFQRGLRGLELRGMFLPAIEPCYASKARQQQNEAGR